MGNKKEEVFEATIDTQNPKMHVNVYNNHWGQTVTPPTNTCFAQCIVHSESTKKHMVELDDQFETS